MAAALVLAAGMAGAALVFGLFFYGARHQRDAIDVTGLASQPFEADQVKWSLQLARRTSESGLAEGYARTHQDVEAVVHRLEQAGVPDSAITLQPITTQPVYGPQGPQGYQVMQSLFVLSSDLSAVEGLALNPAGMVPAGTVLQESRLEYFYSGLADVKRSLLARATEDARKRAAEIAGSVGEKVGGVLSAQAGVFQITEPYSTETAAYGVYNTSSRKKEIRVTVHARFAID